MDFGELLTRGGILMGIAITCIVTLPFLIIALVFVFMNRRHSQQAQASMTWPSVVGTIGAAAVEARTSSASEGGRRTAYYPEVLYEYEVRGQRYMGQRRTFGLPVGYGSHNQAQALVDRYVPGNKVRVYYNPYNPDEAVLEREVGTGSRALMWIAILILVILCITVVPTMLMLVGMESLFSNLPFLR